MRYVVDSEISLEYTAKNISIYQFKIHLIMV